MVGVSGTSTALKTNMPGSTAPHLWCWRHSKGWEARGKGSFPWEWQGSDRDGSSIAVGQPFSTFPCWSSSIRPLTAPRSSLWDAPCAAFPLLQLLARVAGVGAELHDRWPLSLRRIAVAVQCGHGFGALRFILNVYCLSVLHLVNSCTVCHGLSTGEKVKK